jgi:hypothetical protein
MATSTTARNAVPAMSPTRRMVQRWIDTGWGGLGSSRRNSACRSRPWALSIRRSWDGRASPRAAANPSVISSTVNWPRARR